MSHSALYHLLYPFVCCTSEIPEPAAFLSWHWAQVGSNRVFLAIKITMIRQVHMYCGLRAKINVWNAARHLKIVDAFSLRLFPLCGQQKPEYSNLSTMADDTITHYTRSGNVYLCCCLNSIWYGQYHRMLGFNNMIEFCPG